MADRVTVTPQTCVATGITETFVAATAEGISIPGDGRTVVHVKNTSTQITATVQTPETRGGLAVSEQVVTIPATTGDKILGPFPAAQYNRPSGGSDAGRVWIDWSAITGVTYSCFTL
jgi:hypothetical protein